jgi:hypothetical protein
MGGAKAIPARLSVLLLGLLALSATPQSAMALFKVSPTTIDLKRAPGAAALGTIGVKLRGEAGQRYRVLVQDIEQRPDGTQIYLPASGSRYSASSWVTVAPSRFGGRPNRTQPVQYRVIVPPDAEPGDHLASLTVERLAPRTGATAAAGIAISVRLTIRVGGAIRPAARITDLDVPSLADGGPVSIATTVRNSGNVTLDFDRADPGAVRILDGGDRRAILPFEGRLFPGQARVFESRWEDPPLFGSFDAEATVRAGGRPVGRREGFWVIPWRQIAAALLLIGAVLALAFGWRRRRWGY